MSPRSGSIALLAATALYGLQLVVYYPELPDRVASHFDAAGNPDGSMAKDGFLALTLALGVGDCLLFLGLAWMIRVLPDGMINMPNRAYWLAPERRSATLDALRSRLLWLGTATQLFLAVMFHLSIRVSLGIERKLSSSAFWSLLGGYLLFTAAWLWLLARRFRKPG